MAWETRKRTTKVFFYTARREGPKVVKLYCGSGAAAQAAARQVAERRAERRRAARESLELLARTRPAEALLDRQYEAVMALAAATLYAAGFRRPDRHGWRRWRDGERELRAAG